MRVRDDNRRYNNPNGSKYIFDYGIQTHFNVREIAVSKFPKSTVNAYACFI